MSISHETKTYVAEEAERLKARRRFLQQVDDWTEVDRERKRRDYARSLAIIIVTLIFAIAMVLLATARSRAADRPAGCPHRYCGCALSIDYFGAAHPSLFLAANWLKFPRSAPAPGMAAARKGHVMKLLAHVKGKHWQVYDPNSGQGLTRIHVRSIAGFTIVNPRATAHAGI